MLILGIETSCDETAAAVVRDGQEILSNVVVSQIDIFAEYGGVIPEVAARSHLEAILPVIDKALVDAKCSWNEIDAIAVTHAPGLLGSLLIGTLTARTLAILHDKPLSFEVACVCELDRWRGCACFSASGAGGVGRTYADFVYEGT